MHDQKAHLLAPDKQRKHKKFSSCMIGRQGLITQFHFPNFEISTTTVDFVK